MEGLHVSMTSVSHKYEQRWAGLRARRGEANLQEGFLNQSHTALSLQALSPYMHIALYVLTYPSSSKPSLYY